MGRTILRKLKNGDFAVEDEDSLYKSSRESGGPGCCTWIFVLILIGVALVKEIGEWLGLSGG